jgi:hypothetical protein
MWDYLGELQRPTPPVGLSAKTAEFVEHLVQIVGRYGEHLYKCFDDERIPASTNELEGFFGVGKRLFRKTQGAGSTTNCVVTNLGAEALMALQQMRQQDPPETFPGPINLSEYQKARAQLDELERPARKRRSYLRDPGKHLVALLDRWFSSP